MKTGFTEPTANRTGPRHAEICGNQMRALECVGGIEELNPAPDPHSIQLSHFWPRLRHETWRRLSQVLENIIPQNADATVKPISPTKLFQYILLTRDSSICIRSNLVTSLIQHEQVKTTLPKARDAARLAEKVFLSIYLSIFFFFSLLSPSSSSNGSSHTSNELNHQIITLGKKGTHPAWQKAAGFLLPSSSQSLTPKVFGALAARYADRPGGYTRIHKFGHRPGDNAPHAVLELVDGPRDLKFEMAARATGWDVLSSRLKIQSESGPGSARALVREGVKDVGETVERERALGEEQEGELRQRTRWNVRKALRYRSAEDVKQFEGKVQEHMVRSQSSPPPTATHPPPALRHPHWPPPQDTLLARPVAIKALREHSERESDKADQQYFRNIKDLKLKAGDTVPGAAGSALRRAQGDLGWTPGRKVRWFERRKLGIDRPLTWEQV